MLYLAKFQGDLSPLLVDVVMADETMSPTAADIERAVLLIEEATEARPVTMQACPAGIIYGEVRFEDDRLEVAPSDVNPANHSPMGVVLEPFDDFAEWLEEADEAELPAVLALAPTEPPAEQEGSADGG